MTSHVFFHSVISSYVFFHSVTLSYVFFQQRVWILSYPSSHLSPINSRVFFYNKRACVTNTIILGFHPIEALKYF